MNSPIRFTGLTSGMDTQSMVQQIMRAEAMRMNRLTSRRQVVQWRQDDVRAVRTQLLDFNATVVNRVPVGDERVITNANAWNTMRATVTGVNGSEATGINVTATNSAIPQNIRMEVVQTAQAHFVSGGQPPATVMVGGRVDLSTRVTALNAVGEFEIGVGTGDDATSARIQLTSTMTIQDAMDAINRSGAGVTMRFDNLRNTFTLEANRTGEGNEIQIRQLEGNAARLFSELGLTTGFAPGPLVEAYRDEPVMILNPNFDPFDPDSPEYIQDTIPHPTNPGEFLPRVNRVPHYEYAPSRIMVVNPNFDPDDPDTHNLVPGYRYDDDGVRQYYEQTLQRVMVPSETEGNLIFNTVGGNSPRDAQLRLSDRNGEIINPHTDSGLFYSASNIFTEIEGLRIDISGATEGQEVEINVYRNVDDAMQLIRDFVNDYNNLIRQLNALHSTPRPRAGNNPRGAFFEPLTDEQRQGMSDREIEQWESQARIGLLHRDSDIRNIHSQIRSSIMNPVVLEDGSRLFLSHFGIETVGMGGAAGDRLIGVLQIDEDVLRAALESDPQSVQQLFGRNPIEADVANVRPSGTEGINDRNQRAAYIGLGFRLNDIIHNFAENRMGILQERAGTAGDTENIMSRQIRDYSRRIDQMQQFLVRRENQLFAMFARMEQAMAQAHQQMDALFSFGMQ